MKIYRIKSRLCDCNKTLRWLHKQLLEQGIYVTYSNVSMAVNGYRQNDTTDEILEAANKILEDLGV